MDKERSLVECSKEGSKQTSELERCIEYDAKECMQEQQHLGAVCRPTIEAASKASTSINMPRPQPDTKTNLTSSRSSTNSPSLNNQASDYVPNKRKWTNCEQLLSCLGTVDDQPRKSIKSCWCTANDSHRSDGSFSPENISQDVNESCSGSETARRSPRATCCTCRSIPCTDTKQHGQEYSNSEHNFPLPKTLKPRDVSSLEESQVCTYKKGTLEESVPSVLHVNFLPPQVIAHVFSFLSVSDLLLRTGLVCKHWHSISQFPSLWREIRLQSFTGILDTDLVMLCSRHGGVVLLDLSDCQKVSDGGLSESLAHCRMLQELFLVRCSQLTMESLQSIAKHCLKLVHLDVSGCTGLTDDALQKISEACPFLEKLRLKQCHLITDLSLKIVAKKCPRLKVLSFMDNYKITDSALEALAEHSRNLEILCLQGCSIALPGLFHITKMNFLKKLDLSNLSTLTSDGVSLIAKHCQSLGTLNLSLSKHVHDDCVACIAVSCKKLTFLFLISCAVTDKALYSIGESCTRLEHLDVSWCTGITGKGTSFLSDRCPRLKFLGLIRCTQVSDTVVEAMVEKHPNIHYSTFLLDSKRLINKARQQGFVVSDR